MYRLKDLPKKDDLVICTIKEATPSSVFATLDEYDKVEGMIHVSEIARKFVRGMKTYLKAGGKVVCSVMSIDTVKRYAELSLRRVGEGQKRNKIKEWDSERKANDIMEVFAKQNGITTKEAYEKIGNKILAKTGLLFPTILDIAKQGAGKLDEFGIEKDIAKSFAELVEKRIILPKAEIIGTLTIATKAPNGIEIIKKIISEAQALAKKKKIDFEIKYLGAPKYKFKLIAEDFKQAEDLMKVLKDSMEKSAGTKDISIDFKRE